MGKAHATSTLGRQRDDGKKGRTTTQEHSKNLNIDLLKQIMGRTEAMKRRISESMTYRKK